jgi:hypothetical protein
LLWYSRRTPDVMVCATNARGSGNRRPRLRAFTGEEATVAADGHTCEAASPKGRYPNEAQD